MRYFTLRAILSRNADLREIRGSSETLLYRIFAEGAAAVRRINEISIAMSSLYDLTLL